MGLRGILAGALALVALQTVVATPAAGRIAGLFGVPAAIAERFISPAVPAIPERNAKAAAAAEDEPSPWEPPRTTAGRPTSPTGGD